MNLWIVRHGEAEARANRDAERRLTARGQQQAAAAGHWLLGKGARPVHIVASPYRRARETAAVLAPLLAVAVVESALLVPDSSPQRVVDWLAGQRGDLLLVSHQPLVSALAGLLVHGDEGAGPPLGTASVAALAGELAGPGWLEQRALWHATE